MENRNKCHKTKLSIYLVKKEITKDEEILEDEMLKGLVSKTDNCSIYQNVLLEHEPEWSLFLKEIEGLNLKSSSSRVVLLKRVVIGENNEKRIFALSFGAAQSLFKDDVFEERFGLKILLNTLEANQIKQISKRTVGGNQKSSKEQLPKGSDIFEFGFDIQRDLIRSLAGKNDNNDSIFGKRMLYGSNLISFSTNYDYNELDDLLRKCYCQYLLQDYKKRFAWIDNINEETNKNKKQLLDDTLIKDVLGGKTNIWMAVPDLVDWGQISCFEIEGDRKNYYSDIDIKNVLGTLKDGLTNIDQLKRKEIRALSSDDNYLPVHKWNAYKCLVGDVEYEGDEYCICDGKWYKIDNEFVKSINTRYDNINVCDIDFIDYDHNCEDEYNKQLCESLPGSIEMHIKGLIVLDGKSKVEVCDVFYNKKIIHVKREGGPANYSHLFSQILNSSIVWGTAIGRKKINKIFNMLDLDGFNNNDYEFVACIINKNENERPKIPFFSKITACFVADELESKNFGFSLKNVVDKRQIQSKRKKDVKSKQN